MPFFTKDVYPGLGRLVKNAENGCEFCCLLIQLLREHFEAKESQLHKPVQFQLRNAKFYAAGHDSSRMSEEEEDSEQNGVFMLVVELAYGDLSSTKAFPLSVFLGTSVGSKIFNVTISSTDD